MHDPGVHRWEKRRRGETKGLSYSVGQLERRKMTTGLEKIKLQGRAPQGDGIWNYRISRVSQDL